METTQDLPLHNMFYKAKEKPWKWEIWVDKILFDDSRGFPQFQKEKALGVIRTTTTNLQSEDELMYILTAEQSPLLRIVKYEDSGKYLLLVWKQTRSGRAAGLDRYGWYGYSIVSKNRDILLWETKYFQIGQLNNYNLQTRDIQEEQKRGHYKDIPGGGIDGLW